MTKRITAARRLSKKTCKQMTDLVLNYVSDDLAPSIKRDFERHLRICPDCVNFLATYKKTVAATRAVKEDDLPPNVRANILAFLRKRIRQISVFVVYFFSQWVG